MADAGNNGRNEMVQVWRKKTSWALNLSESDFRRISEKANKPLK